MEQDSADISLRLLRLRKSLKRKEASRKANQLIYPETIPFVQFDKIHRQIKNLFKSSEVRNISLAERLQHFAKNWECFAQNPEILQRVSRLRRQFLRKLLPNQTKMNKAESALVHQETEAVIRKGAIHLVSSQKGKFVSNLFLVNKKDKGN